MNNKILTGVAAVALLFASTSWADFSFRSDDSDACMHIAGKWTGTGTISSSVTGTCNYKGSSTSTSVDSNGKFTIAGTIEKQSGSFFCPPQVSKQLTGICTNGTVSIQTEFGNLTGTFSIESGEAVGKLTVMPGVVAEVSMKFQHAE